MCVCFFACWTNKTGKKWCNMPAIHQTRLSTCGLTLSLQLLKYVVSIYWNMYATSVPRNTVSPASSHPASNQEYYSTSRLKGLTMQSHQTVRGIGTMSGEQRRLTLCLSRLPLHLHENGGKMRYGFASDVRARQGRFLYVELVHWLIARSPLAKRSMAGRAATRPKQIRWIIGSQLKTAAASFSKRGCRDDRRLLNTSAFEIFWGLAKLRSCRW